VKAPLIIIGMHRSGTSYVARLLEKSGIFMGVVKDHNYEAMHFLSLNQQVLWAAGGSWHQPLIPDRIYWKHPPAKALYHEHFKANTRLQKASLRWQSPRWGWKEPRNTFTLPMWLALFPKARVLHVVREREGVVRSLMARNQLRSEPRVEALQDQAYAQRLWENYVNTGRSYQASLGARYHEVAYEDLMEEPASGPVYQKLTAYCQVELAPQVKQLRR
jgi:hypothetical protein